MDSEQEEKYGRRRSFKKPQKVKKKEPEEGPNEPASESAPKSPNEILSILETEKKAPEESRPEETARPAERSGRSRDRGRDRSGDRDRGRGARKPSRAREERGRRESSPRYQSKRPDDRELSRDRRTSSVKLSVVIPAFNEEGNVAPLIAQFNQLFSNLPYKAEMIFVDDGSTDKTLSKIKDFQHQYSWLKVYAHRINKGLTTALETGFNKASGKIICFYPSDLQYHANEIPKMVSRLDSGADVVTGWKQGRYGIKALGSFVYNRLSRWLFNVKVHDLNSIKAFKREVSDCFTFRRGWHRYIIVMAGEAGYKIEEVKVTLYPRKSGRSKFGLSQLPIGFLDLLSVKFELSFTKKPLLFFGSAGLITGFVGLLVGLVALYLRFVQHEGFRPLLYLVILLLVSGLLMFAIGFLAELIVSIKEDISRRKPVA